MNASSISLIAAGSKSISSIVFCTRRRVISNHCLRVADLGQSSTPSSSGVRGIALLFGWANHGSDVSFENSAIGRNYSYEEVSTVCSIYWSSDNWI